MAAAIPLRDDFDGPALRALARTSKDANRTRRLLSLAVIYEGGCRSEAAALGGVGLQIIRDWVLRFNAEGPEGLIDRKPPGASPKLNDAQRRALCEIVESGPIPAIHGVVRWRLQDLAQWIWEEFRCDRPQRRCQTDRLLSRYLDWYEAYRGPDDRLGIGLVVLVALLPGRLSCEDV
jgi:transposase